MTTEVAVLNKLAVALAADSASTIDTGRNRKIYNSANKIFDLSEAQPLGLMIYGNAEFMGLPFELVIKEFRRLMGGTCFSTVAECTDRFLSYLSSEVQVSQNDEEQLIYAVARPILREVETAVETEILHKWAKEYAAHDKSSSAPAPDLIDYINAHLLIRLGDWRKKAPSPHFGRTTPKEIAARYSQAISTALNWFYKAPKNAQTDSLFAELIAEVVYREPLSPGKAGVVIAGFGTAELCPSLRWIELDGIFSGSLKWRQGDTIEVGRGSTGAKVIAFAQHDIAELFLAGIGPSDERYITDYVGQQLVNLAGVAKQAVLAGAAQGSAQADRIDAEVKKLANDFKAALQLRKNSSRSRILDMVRFMPVQELVVLAESLIEITSLKRRVTDDLETVGGAVDVAAITRSEGLVWIKRKHYFDPELNSRFFTRQRNSIAKVDGGRHVNRGQAKAKRTKSKAPPSE